MYEDYIAVLPAVDDPEAFGQHSNADITSLITEARVLTETLMSLEIQTSGSQQETKEDKVFLNHLSTSFKKWNNFLI